MMKSPLIFSLLLFVVFSSNLKGQSMEIGGQIGAMVYTGDLDPKEFNQHFQNTNLALGAHFKYNINDLFNVRVNFAKGKVSGRDSISTQEWQRQRNLSFESDITEFSIMVENNLLGFSLDPNENKAFTPYAFAGVAIYKFNPRTLYEGQYVDLQPLGTEGQGMPGFEEKYKLTQFAIPLGGGIKFKVGEKVSVGIELSSRFLFTDYLDDLSGTYVSHEELLAGNGQLSAALANRGSEYTGIDSPYTWETGDLRGKADVKDYYMTAMFSISYHFSGGSLFQNRKAQGCPTF